MRRSHHAKELAVLLLAHKGVQNPGMWLQWANSDKDHPVQLYSLCESGSKDDICLKGLNIKILPSKWCGKEIAVNTLNALKAICRQKNNIGIIYLVSGYCVPLQGPSYLYQESIRLPANHVNGGQLWKPFENSMTVVRKLGPMAIECTQWIALTPETIQTIEPDQELLDSRLATLKCPDEWYIQTLVHRSKCAYQKIAFMDFCHKHHMSKSPEEWNLLSDTPKRVEWTRSSFKTFDVRWYLIWARNAGYSFARKFEAIDGSPEQVSDLKKWSKTNGFFF